MRWVWPKGRAYLSMFKFTFEKNLCWTAGATSVVAGGGSMIADMTELQATRESGALAGGGFFGSVGEWWSY